MSIALKPRFRFLLMAGGSAALFLPMTPSFSGTCCQESSDKDPCDSLVLLSQICPKGGERTDATGVGYDNYELEQRFREKPDRPAGAPYTPEEYTRYKRLLELTISEYSSLSSRFPEPDAAHLKSKLYAMKVPTQEELVTLYQARQNGLLKYWYGTTDLSSISFLIKKIRDFRFWNENYGAFSNFEDRARNEAIAKYFPEERMIYFSPAMIAESSLSWATLIMTMSHEVGHYLIDGEDSIVATAGTFRCIKEGVVDSEKGMKDERWADWISSLVLNQWIERFPDPSQRPQLVRNMAKPYCRDLYRRYKYHPRNVDRVNIMLRQPHLREAFGCFEPILDDMQRQAYFRSCGVIF